MTTPAEAIKLYLDLRDNHLAKLNAEYKTAKNELEDAMAALEGFLLLTMQERNETQIKTAAGVAFRSPQMRVKMVDRELFLDYCTSTHDFSMITNHVSKDAVKEIIEGGGTPPGVEVTEFITCNVRKS